MNSSTLRSNAAAGAALLALTGCGTLDRFTTTQGGLTGAGAGALAGAAVSGGAILPVLGAVSGAVVGSELAEPDPALAGGRNGVRPGPGVIAPPAPAGGVAIASPADLFAQLDDDRNGSLDQAELLDSADVDRDWARFDADGDDRIDQAEFTRRYTIEPGR